MALKLQYVRYTRDLEPHAECQLRLHRVGDAELFPRLPAMRAARGEGAVYSPDGMRIQFDDGRVWQRDIGPPPLAVRRSPAVYNR